MHILIGNNSVSAHTNYTILSSALHDWIAFKFSVMCNMMLSGWPLRQTPSSCGQVNDMHNYMQVGYTQEIN